MATESEYLLFERSPADERGKTQVWLVISKRHGNELGQIRWMPTWRQYAFYPEANTAFNAVCLDDIRRFTFRLKQARRRFGQ